MCVLVLLFVFMAAKSIVSLVRGKKEREKKQQKKKHREGDVGLGDFQALCEQRKRGGGRGKVRPLLNELDQLTETIQSVRLAAAPLFRSDPQCCVPLQCDLSGHK